MTLKEIIEWMDERIELLNDNNKIETITLKQIRYDLEKAQQEQEEMIEMIKENINFYTKLSKIFLEINASLEQFMIIADILVKNKIIVEKYYDKKWEEIIK